MSAVSLTLNGPRVERFFTALRAGGAPEDIQTYVVAFGTTEALVENQRSAAILQNLFATPDPVENVALAFQPTGNLMIVTSRDPATINVSGVPNVTVGQWGSDATDDALTLLLGPSAPIGVAKRELKIQHGPFATAFIAKLDASVADARQRDVAPFLGSLLYVKDESTLDSIAKAGSLCVATMKRFARPYLESSLSSGRPPQLDAFEAMILHKLEHPNEIEGMADFTLEHFAPSLPQRVMHLGRYVSNIQIGDRSTDVLDPNVVCIRFGARHRGEAAFIARTYIVEKHAPIEAANAYAFLADVHKQVVAELRPGVKLADVYAKVYAFATSRNSALAQHLSKAFGWATGLLVLEARAVIGEKGAAVVAADMAFVVRTVLEDVPSPSTNKPFSLELADTVVVGATENEMKTKLARELDDIKYGDAEAEEVEDDDAPQRDLRAITRHGKSAIPLFSREEEREEKRGKLLSKLHAEFLSSGGKNRTIEDLDVVRTHTIGQLATGDITSYGSQPTRPDLGPTQLGVHREKRVAWIPICGKSTPFHVSTISRVDLKKEGTQAVLTIVFHALQEANVAYRLNRTKVFVKDVTFSAPKEEVFHDFVRNVNEAMKDIKNADLDLKNKQGLAKGGALARVSNPKMLRNIKMRPAPVTGKQGFKGNLEAHDNGLRFSSSLYAPVEVFYSNVKHFIFQPSNNSLATIFHVTLKQPILLGKKKADEISFYADVLEASESVESTRKTFDQEVEQEEIERQRIENTNREFAIFAREVSTKSNRRVELPTSFGMDGVTHRAQTSIRASERVIWALADLPPFTLSVSDVEFVSIERVTDSGANFDINFIPKNYKAAIPITIVPRSDLEAFKDWALAAGLYYTESSVNIAWPAMFKNIRDDPDWEPFGPEGWSTLAGENDEEDEEDDGDDSDPSYDSEEDEEDDDEDDSDSDFSFNSDSTVSTADSDDSDASWDALEQKAAKQDREQAYSDEDDDSDQPRRKKGRSENRGAPARGAAAQPQRGAAPSKAPPSRAAPGKMGTKLPPPSAGASKFAMRPSSSAPPQMPRRF